MGERWLMDGRERPDILVSVIIPIYNVKPYLRESLDSVTGQTYRNLEIILVDDGSDDGSGEMCDLRAAADSRITVIHQHNQGLSAARNAGLDRMTGQAVVFMDADDAIHPEMIKTMLGAMQRERADMAVCRYAFYLTGKKMAADRARNIKPPIPPGRYDRISAMRAMADEKLNQAVWNRIYRAELWNGLRFPDGHVYEDLAVAWPLLDRIGCLCVVPDVFCMIRKRPGSITGADSEQNENDWLTSFRMYEEFIIRHTPEIFTEEQVKRTRRYKHSSMIKRYIWHSPGMKNPEEKERLRQQILALEQEDAVRDCGLSVRLAWFLLRRWPGALKVIAPAYRALTNAEKRILGQ